jgi:ribosomal protein S18 acetylase RimI-like enzyme
MAAYEPTPVQIRFATLADTEAVAEIHVVARQAAYRHFFPTDFLDGLTLEHSASLWKGRLEGTTSLCLVAALTGQVAGFLWFGPAAEVQGTHTAEVLNLYVHPNFWRRSIGSQLMVYAVRHMADAGYGDAILNVHEANHRARRFYERAGWREDGYARDAERGGVMIKQLRYRRSLP